MLYDSSRASNLTVSWFDARYWESLGLVDGHARGRGITRYIKAEGKDLVLRPYRRGGLMARFSAHHYIWRGEESARPFREWQLTYRMHKAGLPVAAPVAAHYRRRFGMYTGELITERLAIKGSLWQCLQADTLSTLTWIAVGRCIRRFHDFGVCHADLNARNLLLGEEKVYLIDFDRCNLRKPGLWRDSNLVRLRRSLEKVTYSLPRERFTEADWHALLDGYRQASGKPGSPTPVQATGPQP
jgi:3-deoxy-D-manno-octulosonic acid kinase